MSGSEMGNYELAAQNLERHAVSIGQNVRDLEKYLDCALFKRGYQGKLILTEDGQHLFEGASKIFKESELLENSLRSKKDKAEKIRMLATMGITSDWVERFVPNFLENHPKVRLEISSLTNMAAFDLYHYDVYMGEIFKKDPQYIYKLVKKFQYNFYASPEYIKKYGHPKTAEDLKGHRLIEFNIRRVSGFYKSTDFYESINTDHTEGVAIDSTIGEYKLAAAGVGIACLCEELSFLKGSNLVPVLNDLGPLEVETYFVFHETLRGNKNITALFNAIKAHA